MTSTCACCPAAVLSILDEFFPSLFQNEQLEPVINGVDRCQLGDNHLDQDKIEEALAEERRLLAEKDAELERTEALCARLQDALEQQLKVRELDQAHLARLETALADSKKTAQDGEEAPEQESASDKFFLSRVTKLEQIVEDGAYSSMEADDADQLRQEWLASHGATSKVAEDDEPGQHFRTDWASPPATFKEICGSDGRLDDFETLEGTDQGVLEPQLDNQDSDSLHIQGFAAIADTESALSISTQMSSLLSLISEKEQLIGQLTTSLQQGLQERENAQVELAVKEACLKEAQDQVAEAGDKIRKLEMQLGTDSPQLQDSFELKQKSQTQVLEKERQLCEMQQQLISEMAIRQEIQTQVIEKERQFCEFQRNLADEVSKRQEAEALISEMRNKVLSEVHSLSNLVPVSPLSSHVSSGSELPHETRQPPKVVPLALASAELWQRQASNGSQHGCSSSVAMPDDSSHGTPSPPVSSLPTHQPQQTQQHHHHEQLNSFVVPPPVPGPGSSPPPLGGSHKVKRLTPRGTAIVSPATGTRATAHSEIHSQPGSLRSSPGPGPDSHRQIRKPSGQMGGRESAKPGPLTPSQLPRSLEVPPFGIHNSHVERTSPPSIGSSYRAVGPKPLSQSFTCAPTMPMSPGQSFMSLNSGLSKDNVRVRRGDWVGSSRINPTFPNIARSFTFH